MDENHVLTDAKGRPDIKIVLGLVSGVAALVYIFLTKDAAGFTAIGGFSAILLGAQAIGDAVIDRAKGGL